MAHGEQVGVVSRPPLPYGRQTIEEDDIEAVVAQLRGPWLTQGPTVDRFEEKLAEATGARYVVAVANGTAALHLACLAAGIRAGDVALTSDITFAATANAVRYAGGTPWLVDVDPTTGLIDLDVLERRIDEATAAGHRPKALLPVDFAGDVVDMDRVRTIGAQTGAVVIEDAAHSLGASYGTSNGEHRAGSTSHVSMATLSFHPVKHITTGEGGAITTNDEGLYRELRDLRSHGITKDPSRMSRCDGPWYQEQVTLGFNYRISDIQCALGVSQLAKLGRFVARRREIAAAYDAVFRSLEGVVPLAQSKGSAHHIYVLRLVARAGESNADVAARRLELFRALQEKGIMPQVHYVPLHRHPDFVANGLSHGRFDGAEAYYSGCLSLPLFPSMSGEDVGRVIDAVGSSIEAMEGR